jgi:hypothetical protein
MKASRLRSRVTYANLTSTLALVLALSTGGAYAAATIGAADIKDDAVKTRHIADGQVRKPDLRDGAVSRAKLAPSAQTNIVEYRTGPHNFATSDAVCTVPTGLTNPQIINSVWTVQLKGTVGSGDFATDIVYPVPGAAGPAAASQYRVFIQSQTGPDSTVMCVQLISGPGEAYDAIRFIRTVPTQVVPVPSSS